MNPSLLYRIALHRKFPAMTAPLLILLCTTAFVSGWFMSLFLLTRDLARLDRIIIAATSVICFIVVAIAGVILAP